MFSASCVPIFGALVDNVQRCNTSEVIKVCERIGASVLRSLYQKLVSIGVVGLVGHKAWNSLGRTLDCPLRLSQRILKKKKQILYGKLILDVCRTYMYWVEDGNFRTL